MTFLLSSSIRLTLFVISLMPTFIEQDRAFVAGTRGDAIGLAASLNPMFKPYDEDGNLNTFFYGPPNRYIRTMSGPNPLHLLNERKETQNSFKNIGTVFAEWEIIPDLKVRSSFNTIWSFNDYFFYWPNNLGSFNNPPRPNTGRSATNKNRNFDWLSETTVNYIKYIGDHKFQGLLARVSGLSIFKDIIYS